MGLNPPPHLVPKVLEKSGAIALLTLRVCVAYKKGENLPTYILWASGDRSFFNNTGLKQ